RRARAHQQARQRFAPAHAHLARFLRQVNLCKRHMLGAARCGFAHKTLFSSFRRRAAEQARVPGEPQPQTRRKRHHSESGERLSRLCEAMGEFCAQSYAPLPQIGEKHTKDKSFRFVVIRPETEFAAFRWPNGAAQRGASWSVKDRAKLRTMAHRSNQAVASQDQAAPQPQEDPPRRRRYLIGWATALAALGVSTTLLGAGLWFTRFSIAELLIGAALAERGADAD